MCKLKFYLLIELFISLAWLIIRLTNLSFVENQSLILDSLAYNIKTCWLSLIWVEISITYDDTACISCVMIAKTYITTKRIHKPTSIASSNNLDNKS